MKIQESAEDYLESILMLSETQEFVRAADLCRRLGFSRPTVSQAVHELAADGYLTLDSANHITLTEKGYSIAARTLERHHVISNIFLSIGVPEEIAYEDACRVEHYISPETFRCMKAYYETMIKNTPEQS